MNIAVVGVNGFVGRNIYKFLSPKYTVTGITRQTVNILDHYLLRAYLKKHRFDTIIICAATMHNSILDVQNNLGLITNFYNNRNLFGRLINTASGAEYDRNFNINLATEDSIVNVLPKDYYGLSQNLRSRLCFGTDNFYNLRIFNCFGQGEINTRIFPKILASGVEFTVYDDRYFDYFSIQDLCKVIEYFITETPMYKDINCVYTKKHLISEVIGMFNNIHTLNKNIQVVSRSERNYTGSAQRLETINLSLDGLEQGLINYFLPNLSK